MVMPHFTIEYSANLDASIDIGALCEVVRNAAVQTGMFPLGGIRVRAIRCEHYAIADGRAGLSFLDILLRIGEGRTLPARKRAGEQIFQAVSGHLESVLATGRFALSFDMQINDSATSWKRNGIHDLLQAETAHDKQ
jgi:5-carboxymethyl-2-hydroxymuconate isomerase